MQSRVKGGAEQRQKSVAWKAKHVRKLRGKQRKGRGAVLVQAATVTPAGNAACQESRHHHTASGNVPLALAVTTAAAIAAAAAGSFTAAAMPGMSCSMLPLVLISWRELDMPSVSDVEGERLAASGIEGRPVWHAVSGAARTHSDSSWSGQRSACGSRQPASGLQCVRPASPPSAHLAFDLRGKTIKRAQ